MKNKKKQKCIYRTNKNAYHSVKVEYNRFNKKKSIAKERMKKKEETMLIQKFLFTNFLVSVFVELFVKRSYTHIALFQRTMFNVVLLFRSCTHFPIITIAISFSIIIHVFFLLLNHFLFWLPVSHQNENNEKTMGKKAHKTWRAKKIPHLCSSDVCWNFCVRS